MKQQSKAEWIALPVQVGTVNTMPSVPSSVGSNSRRTVLNHPAKPNRLYEHAGYWLTRRPDTPILYIAWFPTDPPARRICRISTGTADLTVAIERLHEHVRRRNDPASAVPTVNPVVTLSPGHGLSSPITTIVDVLPPLAPKHVRHWEPSPSHPSPACTLADVLCDYLDTLRGKASHANTLYSLKHWREYLSLKQLNYVHELRRRHVDDYVAWRRQNAQGWRGGPLSNATLNRELAVLRAALHRAKLDENIEKHVDISLLPSPGHRERFLSQDEIARLLAACDERHVYRFVFFSLHTLQRPGVILGLHRDQVDLERGRIDFLPVGSTQTNKRRPIVPIGRELRAELERAMAESISGHLIEWMGEPVKRMKRAFATACRRASLSGVTPYTLRHSGATHLAAAGVPLRQIGGMLGHSSERTTEIYAKHAPEFLKDASACLDDLFCAPVAVTSARQLHASCAPATQDRRGTHAAPNVALTTPPESGTVPKAGTAPETGTGMRRKPQKTATPFARQHPLAKRDRVRYVAGLAAANAPQSDNDAVVAQW